MKIIEKIFGSIFLLIGFVFLAIQDLSPTGAVISTSKIADFVSVGAIILMILGAVLFFRSHKD
ncbi:MAG: hypothetical protein AABW50_04825 [Nanoarchaeota archaeon]